MKFVSPIKEAKEIQSISRVLKKQNNRDYVLFLFGIYSGLRISDLLALKATEVMGAKRITIKEKKTGKTKSFPLAQKLLKVLEHYLEHHQEKYLFPSYKKKGFPVTRQQVYWAFNKAAQKAGIDYPVGTHTLRKTFAYWAYKQGTSLELIQKILNHSSPAITLRYIGITQEQMDDVYRKMKF